MLGSAGTKVSRQVSGLVVLLLAVCVLALAVCAPIVMGFNAPKERKVFGSAGAVSLERELNDDGNFVYSLEGEWEFYPNRLYNWSDFHLGNMKTPEIVTFPHTWTSGGADSGAMPAKGYGTYRMRVKIPAYLRGVSVLSSYQYSAYRVFLNDFEVAEAGRIDPDFKNFAMAFYFVSGTASGKYPAATSMENNTDELDVIVQVQNELHTSPGLRGVVYIAGMSKISALESAQNALNSLMVGWLSILFLYFCLVYALNQERKDFFDYAIVTCMMLYTVLTFSGGPMSPYHLAESFGISDKLILRCDYLFPIISAFFAGRQRIRRMLHKHKTAMAAIYFTSSIIAMFYLVAPLGFITKTVGIYTLLTVALWLMPAGFHLIELFKGKKAAAAEQGVTKSQSRADFWVDFTSTVIIIVASLLFLLQISIWNSVNIFVLVINTHMVMQLVVFLRQHKRLEDRVRMLNTSLESEVAERTRELQGMTEQAQKATRYKSDFLAKMSHELRTPLNVIIGMSDLMRTDNFDEEQSRQIKDISETSHSLLGIINDILDFSKIEAGKMELMPEHYNLRALFENIASMNRFLAAAKSLAFSASFGEGTTETVFGDEQRVRQVLTNLVSNAVKYTSEGLVGFYMGEETVDDKPFILARVWDTGIGIRDEDREKLFDSFEQFDREKNKGITGTGLGLAITKQLLDMMGGTIRVESVYGEGSTFTVRIPLVEGDPARVEDGAKDAVPVKAVDDSLKALVVDDFAANITVAVGILSVCGIHADTAGSGREALEKAAAFAAKGKRYDFILIDHMMPEMDGLETTRRLREMEKTWAPPEGADGEDASRETPIIAYSANVSRDPKTKEVFLAAGMNDAVPKPAELKDIYRVLKKWLPADKITIGEVPGKADDDEARAALAGLEPLGIDLGKALSAAGSPETLKAFLKRFAAEFDGDFAALKAAYEKKDWKDYGIRVHGFKSLLASAGKQRLSDTAQRLETASKEGRTAECEEATGDFLAELSGFGTVLKAVPLDAGPAAAAPTQTVDAAALIERLEALHTAALGARNREAAKASAALDGCALEGDGAEMWKNKWTKLKDLLYNYEYAEVAGETAALIETLKTPAKQGED